MMPSAIATSAMRPGAPLPSITVPPRITRSAAITTLRSSDSERLSPSDRPGGPSAGEAGDQPAALQRWQRTDERRLIQRRVDRGGDVRRRDAVDPDAVLRQLDRDRPGEMD